MELKINCDNMPLIIEVHKRKEGKDASTYKYVLRTADSFSLKQLNFSGLLLNDIFEMLGFGVKNLSVHDMAQVSEYVVNMDQGYQGKQGNILVTQNKKTKETDLRVGGNGIWTDDLYELVEVAKHYFDQHTSTL